jgi:hypothetical protein
MLPSCTASARSKSESFRRVNGISLETTTQRRTAWLKGELFTQILGVLPWKNGEIPLI